MPMPKGHSLGRRCTLPDCDRKHYGRGFRQMHLTRLNKHGDVNHVDQIWHDDEARFWSYVEKTSAGGCWLWTGKVESNGYGRFAVGLTQVGAHRYAHELLIGPIPDGHTIDHVAARGCRHKHCVNPAHLEAVEHRENTMRAEHAPAAINAAKTECLRGHPFDSANTYINPTTGARRCRACRRRPPAAA